MPKKPRTTALLIVDLQKGFGATKRLVDRILKASEDYDLVVATQFVNGNRLATRASKSELERCALPARAKVFKKDSYGLPQALIRYLKRKGIRQVDICGLETEACVLAAAFNLWDAEIKPQILKDLIASSAKDKRLRKAALLVMHKNFE